MPGVHGVRGGDVVVGLEGRENTYYWSLALVATAARVLGGLYPTRWSWPWAWPCLLLWAWPWTWPWPRPWLRLWPWAHSAWSGAQHLLAAAGNVESLDAGVRRRFQRSQWRRQTSAGPSAMCTGLGRRETHDKGQYNGGSRFNIKMLKLIFIEGRC